MLHRRRADRVPLVQCMRPADPGQRDAVGEQLRAEVGVLSPVAGVARVESAEGVADAPPRRRRHRERQRPEQVVLPLGGAAQRAGGRVGAGRVRVDEGGQLCDAHLPRALRQIRHGAAEDRSRIPPCRIQVPVDETRGGHAVGVEEDDRGRRARRAFQRGGRPGVAGLPQMHRAGAGAVDDPRTRHRPGVGADLHDDAACLRRPQVQALVLAGDVVGPAHRGDRDDGGPSAVRGGGCESGGGAGGEPAAPISSHGPPPR